MTRALRRWWRSTTALALILKLSCVRRRRHDAEMRLEAAMAALGALAPISAAGWQAALDARSAAMARVTERRDRLALLVDREAGLIHRIRAASVEADP